MRVKTALNLGQTSNAQILVEAAHYITNMTGNSLFAAADITAQVTTTNTALTALRTVMNAPTSDMKVDNVNVARDVLDRNLIILAGKIEALANNPSLPDDQRVGIVHSAGMEVKGQPSPQKRVFAVTQGEVSGSAELTAASGAKAHEWHYTSDVVNFTNRIAAPSTTTSRTVINALTPGTRYAFFHKPIAAGTVTEWEGPLFCTVV